MSAETSINNLCVDDGLDRWDRSYMSTRDRGILALSDIYVHCSSDKRANCLSASCVKIPNGTRFYLLEKSHKLGFYNFFYQDHQCRILTTYLGTEELSKILGFVRDDKNNVDITMCVQLVCEF